jgi:hypothetical protein
MRLWLREQMKAAVRERKVIGKAIITPIGAKALSALIEEWRVCIILIGALQAKHASLIKPFVMLKDAPLRGMQSLRDLTRRYKTRRGFPFHRELHHELERLL